MNNTILCHESHYMGHVKKRQETDPFALNNVSTSLLGPKVKMKDWVSKWLESCREKNGKKQTESLQRTC